MSKIKHSYKTWLQVLLLAILPGMLLLPSEQAQGRFEVLPIGTFVAFGPNDYNRTSNKPITVTETFSVLNPNTSYTLHIYNGGDEGQFEKKVSSGVITLNKIVLLKPNDFNQNTEMIEVPVELKKDNELSVELRSAPGSGLTVLIVGVDNDPPEIIATASPPPNAAGWNNTDVSVSFECYDETSGIQFCPEPILVDTEGAGQVITGTAVDNAGNTASASVTLNIDKTPPTIVAHVDPPPNAAGWNNTDVTVSFECTDATSGIASCPTPVLVTGEGAEQAISGTATDYAGHTNVTTVLVNLDKTPPTMTIAPYIEEEEPELEILYIRDFELIWDDQGSEAARDGSFYKPIPPAGYFVLGYYGQGDYGPPNGSVAVAKELFPGALAQPVDYELIWKDTGSDADRDGAFWRPIPPNGYTCLGVVVTGYPRTTGYAPPNLDEVRCVRKELASPAKVWMPIWNDDGSEASTDVGNWIIAPWNEDGLHLGLMAAQGYARNEGYAPPTSDLWVLKRKMVRGAEFPLNDQALEVGYTHDFELIWDDQGSEAARDGSFYKPIPPAGYFVLGYYGQGDYGPPNGSVAVVKELFPGALAQPVGYEPIWKDIGSGANRDGAFWRPIPPDGYTCLGVVVTGYPRTTGYAPPSLDAIRCVRTELTNPASIDRGIWDDRGSPANWGFSSWHIVPNNVGGVYLGSFAARGWASGSIHDIPPEQPIYVLHEAAVSADTWMTEPVSRFNGVATDTLSGLTTVSCNGMPASLTASEFHCDVPLTSYTSVTIIAMDVAGNATASTQTLTSIIDALDASYATSFDSVWNDRGSGALYSGAFYRPIVTSEGFVPLGHYGQGDYGTPVGLLLLVKQRTPGALTTPVGYELIWRDVGSDADRDGAFWWPLPPPGYRCLGVVATGYPKGGGYALPSLDEVRCIRKELVAPGYVGSRIWIDERSKASRDFGSWQIAPSTGNGLHTGAFAGRSYPSDGGYEKATRPVWVVDRQSIAGSVELSEAEITALIDTYAPVLAFYPGGGGYSLDDPEYVLNHAKLCWALVRNEENYEAQRMEPEGWNPEDYCTETSASTLMDDAATIENEYKPNPPYNNDPDFRIWLQIPDELKPGNLDRAKPLVHVRPRGAWTEIQFWYFYPFNGPGKLRICLAHCEYEQFEEAGRHYGDWETVLILIDNRTQEMVAAALSQHGLYQWISYDALSKYPGRENPIVYVAFNSHAIYSAPGEFYYEVAFSMQLDILGLVVATLYDKTASGTFFFMEDYYLASEEPDLYPDWLKFKYRWGQYIWNHDDVYFMSTNYHDQDEIGMGPTGPAMKAEW